MTNTATPGEKLRAAVAANDPLQVVGAVNAYSAIMAQKSGHKALYLSGGGVAACSLGKPDLGITTLKDVLEDVYADIWENPDHLRDVENERHLLRTVYLSLDPYMRGRMNAGASYAQPVEIVVRVGGIEDVAARLRHQPGAGLEADVGPPELARQLFTLIIDEACRMQDQIIDDAEESTA